MDRAAAAAASSPAPADAHGISGAVWLACAAARIARALLVRPLAPIARSRFLRQRLLSCVFACSLAMPTAAAGDLRVLCPNALRTPMLESTRSFARAGGHRVEFVFASVTSIHKRVATGERADVAIGTLRGAQALVGLGRAKEGSVVPLVESALALVVPKHAGALDVADPAAIAQRLREARTLLAPDAGLGVPGGTQAAELLKRLDLKKKLRGRIRYVADVKAIATRVASGAADAGLGTMSELLGAREVSVLGPIREPRTEGASYAGLIVRPAVNAGLARAFLAHLRAPESRALFRSAGFLPLD